MRKTIRVSVLLLALSVPAFGGDIPYGVTGSQTPPPQSQTTESEPTQQKTIVEVILDLIQGVISTT